MIRNFIFLLLAAALLAILIHEPAKTLTTRILNTPIPAEMNGANIPLATSLDLIAALTDLKLTVQWDVLNAAGITRDSPVTMRLLNVKASKAISTILNDAGGGDVSLTWFTENDGTVLITTADDLVQTHSIINTYDIRDIIADANPAKRSEKIRILIASLDFNGRRNSPDDAKWNSFRTRENAGIVTIRRLPEEHKIIPAMLEQLRKENLVNGVPLSNSTVLDDWRAAHDIHE